MTKRKLPPYERLVSETGGRSRHLHPVTRALLALAPGEVFDATPKDGDIVTERNRITSRLRSVKIQTGADYSVTRDGDRLYVVRLRGDEVSA